MLKKVNYKDVVRFTWYYWRQKKHVWPVLLIGMGLTGILDTLFPVFIGNLLML